MEHFRQSMLKLIVQTSTNLPGDVRKAMEQILDKEEPGSRASMALATIARNIDMACENEGAICQDTGMPTFKIKTPVGVNQIEMKKAILLAVEEATKLGKLRPNTVDSITGKNSGNNIGNGAPVFYWEQWEKDYIEVKLLLKGGGCENKNIQYSLPAVLDHLGKPDGTSKACASASCTRYGRRRGRAVRWERLASPSVRTGLPAMRTRRNSCSGSSTTVTRMQPWPRSKTTSWSMPTA